MKQVKFRSVLLLLLIVLLGLGLALFCLRYTFRGEAWASFSANGHAYTDGVVRTGQVLDRNGTVLYDGPSGVYHEDSALRQATLHAVGDQLGNISTSALEAFQSRLIGFDPLTGTLSGGHKVYLTIDADLSRTAWEALDGRKGVAAVYNYETGDILCMVSNPSFDPADPPEISDDDSDYEGVYLNRLLSGLYTPGSVFKVVTTAAALEQLPGVEERTFTCDGGLGHRRGPAGAGGTAGPGRGGASPAGKGVRGPGRQRGPFWSSSFCKKWRLCRRPGVPTEKTGTSRYSY